LDVLKGAKVTSSALIADLEGIVPGGVFSEIFDRKTIANDASHYLLTPLAVVRPNKTSQIGELFRVSQEQNIGLTFRSGGTSLSGQAVSAGLLVDTRRHFKEIEVLENGAKARVQPGATVRQVNLALARFGRKLGPDPASEIACTIGGVVANNSSGMACGTEFNSYATVDSLKLVLPSGTVIDTAMSDADDHLRSSEARIYEGLSELRKRILDDPISTRKIRELYSIKNTMGYSINSFLDYVRPIDILTHLVIGSEGTLAFIAEVTFRTIPLLQKSATGLLIFENLADATDALPELKTSQAAVIELLDSASLRVAQREHMADSVLAGIAFHEHAALLVEYQAATAEEISHQMEIAQKVFANLPIRPTPLSRVVSTRNELWHARKGLYAAVAGNRPSGTTAILEDIAVPMRALNHTTMALSDLFRKHKYEGSVIFGHAKDGNLHFLLNEQFDRPEYIERYQEFTEDMVLLVLDQGGSLKAEHGTGRIMAPYVRRQFGDKLYEVMVEVKRLCDPTNLLNPGVLINKNDLVHIEDLKISPKVDAEVDRCVECGYCEPVCPSRNLTMTPRQRIVIRRAMADAKSSGDDVLFRDLTNRYEYDAIQTCAADSMCSVACPVHIDTGTLVTRLRAEQQGIAVQKLGSIAARNWKPATALLAKTLTVAANLPPSMVHGANDLLRKMVGEDAIPRWTAVLPRGGSTRKAKVNPKADLLYFPSCMNSLFGPSEGSLGVQEAFLTLCRRAGIAVAVPESIGGLCCGTPWKSKGLTQGQHAMTADTKNAILTAVKESGMPVVCDATSCTDGLTSLFTESKSEVKVLDALEFVADRVLPKLTISQKVASVVLHPTCSGMQLGLNVKMSQIAHALAEEVNIPENWACCGFAGDRGLLHPELTASATASEAAEVRGKNFTKYASANRPCEIGMSQATGKTYIHLLELLEQATRS
jgi:D-lactate dehydrogenase